MNRAQCSVLISAVLLATLVSTSERFTPVANAETAESMLATQIRSQGFACDKPQQATRDAKLSKPDYDVWVLKCENATYRMGRYPDLPANIEKLNDGEGAGRKK